MRYFEKMQRNIIAYRDILSFAAGFDNSSKGRVEELERAFHDLNGNIYPGIADLLTSLINYVRVVREYNDVLDMDYICETVDELYYLFTIADQGIGEEFAEYIEALRTAPVESVKPYEKAKVHDGITANIHGSVEEKGKNEQNSTETLAKQGVSSAEFQYGRDFFLGTNGCEKNKREARRWLLLASAHGYVLSDVTLEAWFEINTQEAKTPHEMFKCGTKYFGSKNEQEEDLAFFWYYKAYHLGYTEAANNLGVCYDEAKGTARNYERANQLYLVGIAANNASSYHNYGVNLYYGCGISMDRAMAHQYVAAASNLGCDAAKRFLKERFEIDENPYKTFETLWFEYRDGIYLSFDKIEVVSGGIKLTFWGKNSNKNPRAFWLEYYSIDGKEKREWSKLAELNNNQSEFFSFIVEDAKEAEQITVALEVDKNATEKLFSYPKLVILLDKASGTVTPFLSSNMEDVDEGDRIFEDVSFEIYDKDHLYIEFCNFEIEDDGVYMTFWVNNKSNQECKLWAIEVNVDGIEYCYLVDMGTVKAGDSDWCKLKLDSVSAEGEHTVDCYIEIDDIYNNKIDSTRTILTKVNFDEFIQSVELIEEISEEEGNIEFEDIEFVTYDNDDVYIEFCNVEADGDEYYLNFWISNDSEQTINVYVQEIYFDGVKVCDYMHIGEVKRGEHTYGKFKLEQIVPNVDCSIIMFVEIDDENHFYINAGDTFAIDIDFKSKTISAEMI